MNYLIYLYISAGACAFLVIFAFLLKKYVGFIVDRRISLYQNDLIKKHCDEVENIYRQMRGWRHDYHNHIQAMKAYLALNQTEDLGSYLGKLDEDLVSVDTIIKTGNVMIDAILNSKISLARSKKIYVNAKAAVPKILSVQEVDLCVVIGNLLDNAIEACLKQPDEKDRFIRIYIDTHKELLYISVSNSVGGRVRRLGKSYLSTKDSQSHGFGLMRIDKISAKYKGYIDRQNEDGIFATEVLLPL